MDIDKKELKEQEIRTMFITPALNNHGKTKSARIQKRNVFSTDKNEM